MYPTIQNPFSVLQKKIILNLKNKGENPKKETGERGKIFIFVFFF